MENTLPESTGQEQAASGLIPAEIVQQDIGKFGQAGIHFDGEKAIADIKAEGKLEEELLKGLISISAIASLTGAVSLNVKGVLDLIKAELKKVIPGTWDDALLDGVFAEVTKKLGVK